MSRGADGARRLVDALIGWITPPLVAMRSALSPPVRAPGSPSAGSSSTTVCARLTAVVRGQCGPGVDGRWSLVSDSLAHLPRNP